MEDEKIVLIYFRLRNVISKTFPSETKSRKRKEKIRKSKEEGWREGEKKKSRLLRQF